MAPMPNRLGTSLGRTPVVRPERKPEAARAFSTGLWRATSPEYFSSQKPCGQEGAPSRPKDSPQISRDISSPP